MSAFIFQFRQSQLTLKTVVFQGLSFSIGIWLLTSLFILILERFFRTNEHYSLNDLPQLINQNWVLLVDGLLWFILYQIVFSWLNYKQKTEALETRIQDLEKEISQADLIYLRKEINPHFLFNAMNGIAMKVRLKENKAAVAMIAALNNLLRLSLSKSKEQLITLHQELELLDSYLLIEKHRFGDHVQVEIDFPEETRSKKVPELILQPLVENAFKHGLSLNQELQHISISGKLSNEQIILSVFNTKSNGVNFNFAKSGIGLPNIVHRLRRIYNTNFKFQSFNEEHGIAFTITLPQAI
tara:strand:+ start:2967 stop:3860 length:894 start_codon:yes stop_codon:yes gene_type:complete